MQTKDHPGGNLWVKERGLLGHDFPGPGDTKYIVGAQWVEIEGHSTESLANVPSGSLDALGKANRTVPNLLLIHISEPT